MGGHLRYWVSVAPENCLYGVLRVRNSDPEVVMFCGSLIKVPWSWYQTAIVFIFVQIAGSRCYKAVYNIP